MKTRLQNDMKEAMRAKDKVRLSTIRSLLSAAQYEEMQKAAELKEEQFIAIFKNEIKKRKESLEYLEKEQRHEEVEIVKAEAKIIESYLPQQIDSSRLKVIILEFKQNNPTANMGQAMAYLKEKFAGQYDGKDASTLAKEIMA